MTVKRKPLILSLFPSYLLVVVASLLLVLGYAARSIRTFYLDQTAAGLEARAALLIDQFNAYVDSENFQELQYLCMQLGAAANTRITVVLPTGKVVADSEESPETMDNHADRPEIKSALAGGFGVSTRFSATLQKRMMYVAVPMDSDSKTRAIVRVALPITAIEENLWSISSRIVLGGAVVALLAAGISWIVSRRITQPLSELKQGAERFARGDLQHPLKPGPSLEVAALADSMNRMAEQLDARIRQTVQHKNEQDAVLSSMIESVLAVDNDGNLIILNEAAAKLFGIDPRSSLGRKMSELIRNTSFQKFVASVLGATNVIEEEITFHLAEDRYHRAHGTRLIGAGGEGIGAVVVLHDVTQIRRLERVRQDFVANVSHELRTPVTAIKGFVETLIDTRPADAAEVQRFLEIIAKNANQLSALIDDFLTLARIEQEERSAETILERANLARVVDAVVEACTRQIEERRIHVDVACPADIQARVNPSLLQQAIGNLLDNAVKYSKAGATVQLNVTVADSEIRIKIRDEGPGIAQEHLPRLFERFYRVDRARSREQGGTGLGLAITKHVAEIHGGRVDVESRVGAGSTFSLYLPVLADADGSAPSR